MIEYTKTETGYTAQVVLSTGEVAGEGYAQTAENAAYFAIKDASQSADPRHRTIAAFYERTGVR